MYVFLWRFRKLGPLSAIQDSKMVCVSGSVSPRKVGSSLSHSFFKSIFYLQYLYSLFILTVEIVAIFLCIYIYICICIYIYIYKTVYGSFSRRIRNPQIIQLYIEGQGNWSLVIDGIMQKSVNNCVHTWLMSGWNYI